MERVSTETRRLLMLEIILLLALISIFQLG